MGWHHNERQYQIAERQKGFPRRSQAANLKSGPAVLLDFQLKIMQNSQWGLPTQGQISFIWTLGWFCDNHGSEWNRMWSNITVDFTIYDRPGRKLNLQHKDKYWKNIFFSAFASMPELIFSEGALAETDKNWQTPADIWSEFTCRHLIRRKESSILWCQDSFAVLRFFVGLCVFGCF